MFGLFAKPKRRSSSGGGSGKMLDTVLAIAVLGGVAVVGYYVIRGGKGFGEAQDTAGRGLKNLVDAADSTFDAIAKAVPGIQKGFDTGAQRRDAVGRAFDAGQRTAAARRDAVGEAVGNFGCQLQNGFSTITGGVFGKGPNCRGRSDDKQVINDIKIMAYLENVDI